ncbi:MAG: hypothetical protein WDA07_07085 [Leucobacter sp.]
MSEGARRGVTRGYVGALIAATGVVAAALTVASWGILSLALQRSPVLTEGVPVWVAPVFVIVLLAGLAWALWNQAVTLLKGRRQPQWGSIFVVAIGAYLVWCLGGVLAGMQLLDTWLSPFSAALVVIWAVSALIFWAVLSRRVYTDRPPPRWPWERDEETG